MFGKSQKKKNKTVSRRNLDHFSRNPELAHCVSVQGGDCEMSSSSLTYFQEVFVEQTKSEI